MAISKVPLTFRIFQNDQLIREETLTQGVIKLGKVPSAHLRIDDETVSRMHAILEVNRADDIQIIDLGSTGGTFVNDQRINKAKLRDGDSIKVGNTRIEFSIGAPVQAAQLAAVPMPAVPPPTIPAPAVPAPAVRLPAVPASAVPISATSSSSPAFGVPRSSAAAGFLAPTTMPAAAMAIDDAEPLGGARSVEVAAMLGDSVIGVKHCIDPNSGKISPTTWGWFAAGAASLIVSAVAFGVSVHTAAFNKGSFEQWTRVEHKPESAWRPREDSLGLDWLAFGGLALGLTGVTAGLFRMRNERKSPYYRIGTAPGVEMPTEHAPAASFPLVAPSGDDFVFNYGHGIDGELTIDGKATPLAELAASGRARPAAALAGAIEVPIPPKAKIRARAGKTTFLISAVAQPRRHAMPLFAGLESRMLGYFGGSLAVHFGIWALLQLVPADDGTIDVALTMNEPINTNGKITENTDPPPPPPEETDGDDGSIAGGGKAMALEQGAAGDPNVARVDGHIRVKDNHTDPGLAKIDAIAYARQAGFLGADSALNGGFASLIGQQDLSSAFDGTDVWGPIVGAEGAGNGNFGMGRRGWGVGGGCMTPPCGTVSAGTYGTIGWGLHAGDGFDARNGHHWGRGHKGQVPVATLGTPTPIGGLDKSIIRRYVKRQQNSIAYCYEKELLAKPGLQGEVMVQFLITSDGSVQSSHGRGMDPNVSSCVADVVHGITFPRPSDGGSVQVNYPFEFHRAGATQ